MSDLSQLFKSPLSNSSSPLTTLSRSSSLPPLSAAALPVRASSEGRKQWRLSELEAGLRKGIRREVSAEAMRDELRVFFQLQKGVASRRVLVVLGAAVFFLLGSGIGASILFTLVLLVGSELLCSLVLPFSDPIINTTIRRVQPVIFCTIFYSLLKWATGSSPSQIDWPITFLAIVCTIARGIIIFYEPYFQLSTRSMIAEGVRQKSVVGKLFLFPKYLIYRVLMVFGMAKHLVIVTILMGSALAAAFFYFNKLTLECLQPSYILSAVPLFLALQLFMDFVGFVNLTFTQDIALSRVMKDKMPMYLSLLRLEFTPANRLVLFFLKQVQLECLKSVLVKVGQVKDFLTTQTYKSFIYTTVNFFLIQYMDVFNQFVSAELQRVNNLLTAFLLTAKNNDRIIALQKSLLQDILIYFRKAWALMHSEWQASKAIEAIGALSFLLQVVEKVQQGGDEGVQLSGRVLGLLKGVRDRLQESAERSSLCSFTRGELMRVFLSISREEFLVGRQ